MVRRGSRRSLSDLSFPLIRDILLFVGGMAGVFYETVFVKVDRPTLLLLFAAMLGLPAFLQANESRQADEMLIDKAVEKVNARRKAEQDTKRKQVERAEEEAEDDRLRELQEEFDDIARRRAERQHRNQTDDFDLDELEARLDREVDVHRLPTQRGKRARNGDTNGTDPGGVDRRRRQ